MLNGRPSSIFERFPDLEIGKFEYFTNFYVQMKAEISHRRAILYSTRPTFRLMFVSGQHDRARDGGNLMKLSNRNAW